ncbi:MAG: hypothetical protein NZT92_06470 [Abditibacteriales bacterium]|nr:hypothetical protein [Abditibacteriales bacterium]MDW8365703.1 hypothetical protein [Abditibacteriales bacterium]
MSRLRHHTAGKCDGKRSEAIPTAAVFSSAGDGFAALAMTGIFKGGIHPQLRGR